jgi:hypothetical protein
MNRLGIITFLILISIKSFGQKTGATKIEKDLHYWMNKIDYWQQVSNHDDGERWIDSLTKANQTFGKKLKFYTSTYPSTINQQFKSLENDVNIYTADDGCFRIYNWYTGWGGIIVDMGNLLQFKAGEITKSVLTLGQQDAFNITNYFKLYHIDINHQPYLAAYSFSLSHDENGHGEGIRVFTVKNGELDQNAKIIKTASGLHNQLSYYYTPGEISGASSDWSINYDPITKTISLPVVLKNGTITNKRIFYKFTGQYFERLKS